MKIGGASWNGVLDTSLTEAETAILHELLGSDATDEFIGAFSRCFKSLDWDGYDSNAATWSETRPEMERLVSVLEKFNSDFCTYANATNGTPKAASIYLAINPIEEWEGHPRYGAANDAPHYAEIRDILENFRIRAEKNLEKQIEIAKRAGRQTDLNLGQVILNVAHLLRQHQITFSITTKRNTNEMTSPFWSLVVEIVGRLRNKQYAGCNSQQAALRRVKRDLQEFRKKYPSVNEGPKGHTS